jgi:hypothetical protein
LAVADVVPTMQLILTFMYCTKESAVTSHKRQPPP